jgi:hypothetical protein
MIGIVAIFIQEESWKNVFKEGGGVDMFEMLKDASFW